MLPGDGVVSGGVIGIDSPDPCEDLPPLEVLPSRAVEELIESARLLVIE
jgi:hypothetical protein